MLAVPVSVVSTLAGRTVEIWEASCLSRSARMGYAEEDDGGMEMRWEMVDGRDSVAVVRSDSNGQCEENQARRTSSSITSRQTRVSY